MTRSISAVLALCLLAGAPAMACTAPDGSGGIKSGLVSWVNEQRAARGLKQLVVNPKLESAARTHACDMAEAGKMAHQVPGGPSFQARIKRSGYRMRTAVENIARSSRQGSADVPARLWRDSSGHWANILNPALREVGIGVATDGSSVYYVYVGGASR